uniref:Zinc finger HIT domain containing protein 2 n=1 Tax=Homo sapiens TaxID=9606 RepID=UPI00005E6137|nr:Chain A, Zinc finger HIT domain containing protein 2 [Homo sapiens]
GSSGSSGMEPAGPCGFCPAGEVQPARYTCPRCNAPYCSLRCYRTHGTCAENFYSGPSSG